MAMADRQRKWHPSITLDRVMAAVELHHTDLEDPGFCLACGLDTDGVEPDARNYKCEYCGEHQVYGAEELLLMMV